MDDARGEATRSAGRLRRPVVFVGMPGSGKSAIGRSLAERLGVPVFDCDVEIERAANATIAEIFERDGETFFRDREAEVLRRLLRQGPGVVSTGGGAWLAERNRAAIGAAGVSVWLDADLDLLWDRVRHKDTRPLLRGPDPRGALAELYAARVPLYRLAELRVDAAPGLTIPEMTERVLEVLADRPDVLEPAR